MKSSNLFGAKSRIKQGSSFFVSLQGHQDPLAELKETIKILKNPSAFLEKGLGHPHCLFPARLKVISEELKLSFKRVNCHGLDQWKGQIKADDIFIVYASQFISNPASVMGHTFIKFKSKKIADYLNISMGYAADVPEDAGPLEYAYKGLFGGFKGVFSQYPFYEKVHEYNNIERRDIWEYKLKLTAKQRDLFLDHLWELKFTADIDYYFFDENCSFMILAAVQAVVPGKELTSRLGVYVAPIETVKVLSEQGLIDGEVYRPSIRKQFVTKYHELDGSDRESFKSALKTNDLNERNSVEVLDTLLDYFELQKQINQGELTKEIRKLRNQTLILRSRHSNVAVAQFTVRPESPLIGHKTGHADGLYGIDHERQFSGLQLRPGIHALQDSDIGYLKNSSFNFMQLDLRKYNGEKRIRLSRFTLFDVAARPPYNSIEPQVSWAFKSFVDLRSNNHYHLQPSFGVTFNVNPSIDFNLMQVNDLSYSTELNGHFLWDVGIMGKIIFLPVARFKTLISTQIFREIGVGLHGYKVDLALSLRTYRVASHLDLGIDSKIRYHLNSTNKESINQIKVTYDF